MAIYKIKRNQNIFDLALQLYGDVSGIGDLMTQNPDIDFGYIPKIGDEINYDVNNIVNNTIVQYFSDKNIIVSNGSGDVYFKETNEELKCIIFIESEYNTFNLKASGSGYMVVDWGDNSKLETITLTDTDMNHTHNMNSVVSSNNEYRKIRIYGEFSIDNFQIQESGIVKIFAIEGVDVFNIDISKNYKMNNIGFLDIVNEAILIKMSEVKVGELLPLINQTNMRDLWINDSLMTSDTLDDYFIGLVKGYSDRPSCDVRMWGNNSPSGLYQRPDKLSDPQSGLEAMWVLENERGWTIQEIITPPNEADIIRRMTERDGSYLIDSVNNDRLKLFLPVSEFISANNSLYTTTINASTVNIIEFKTLIQSLPATQQTFVGAKDNIRGTHFNVDIKTDGTVYFSHGADSYTSEINIFDNLVHIISIDARGSGMRCFIDGKFLAELAPTIEDVDSLISFGGLLDSDGVVVNYLDGIIWDCNVGDGQYIIPLPHLGYDTTTGTKHSSINIKESFLSPEINGVVNEGGSEYMQLNGAVLRRPNLIADGYAEKIGTGGSYQYWTSAFNGTPLEFADIELELSASLKVNQEAFDNDIESRVICSFYDDLDANIGEVFISIKDIAYGNKSIKFTPPNNAYKLIILAEHWPDTKTDGNVYAKEIKLTRVVPEVIPDKIDGKTLFPLLTGDNHVPGTGFLNTTPSMLNLYSYKLSNSSEFNDEINCWPINITNDIFDILDTQGHLLSDFTSWGELRQTLLNSGKSYNLEFDYEVITGIITITSINKDGTSTDTFGGPGQHKTTFLVNSNAVDDFLIFSDSLPFEAYLNSISVKDVPALVSIWDKSNQNIWKDTVRNSVWFDKNNTFNWNTLYELNMSFLYENIQDEYKYLLWVKIDGGAYKDIFQYSTPLTGDNKNRCDRYVHLNT